MRRQAISLATVAVLGLCAAGVAHATVLPQGNFGGGALVSPPLDIFGAGNAVVALRALPERRLEIEATVRARCAGGDISATAKISPTGTFQARGTATQDPDPTLSTKTTYELSGRFMTDGSAEGTISATIERTSEGATQTCRSGTVRFSVRRPTGGVGSPGAPRAARYYGTTSQRGAGPSRPIVLRVSADGTRLTRGLFGESVKCSDGQLAIGLEAPSTNVSIDARGHLKDHEMFKITQGETVVFVNDHFTADLGSKGAHGTLSLSDRTTDRASGRTIRTCKSGTVTWRASR